MQGRSPGFQLPNNVATNLYIPPSKQRNLMQQGASGSPMLPIIQVPGVAAAPSATVIQQMINKGIPVNQQIGAVRSQMAGLQSQIAGQDIKPYMLLQAMKQQPTQGQSEEPRPHVLSQVRHTSDMVVPQLDRSHSLWSKVSWQPNAEHDAVLKDKISSFQRSLKPFGRATLGRGLGMNRTLGDVLLEHMPEGLRAIAEEAESGAASDVEGSQGGKGKVDAEGSGMPGQKKRKVQELAGTIDKVLVVDRDVETVSLFSYSFMGSRAHQAQLMLQLADEHCELVSTVSCSLAKYRKSDTIDRKDMQLAYGMFPMIRQLDTPLTPRRDGSWAYDTRILFRLDPPRPGPIDEAGASQRCAPEQTKSPGRGEGCVAQRTGGWEREGGRVDYNGMMLSR